MKSEKFLLILLMAVSAVFTIGYSYYVVNPALHYHLQQIAWGSGKLFRDHYMAFSGGPGEYLALYISQFFVMKGLGSAIVSVSGLLISLFIYKVVQLKSKGPKLAFLWIPLIQIIFLALMQDYRYHFSITINLVVVSGFLFLCSAIENRKWLSIHFHTIIGGILIYYISGGMYFLIFMLSSIILLFGKPYYVSLINTSLIILEALLIPFISYYYIFLFSLSDSFFRSTPDVAIMIRYSKPFLFYIGLASIPAIILLVKLFSIVPITKKQGQVLKISKGKSKIKKRGRTLLIINPRIFVGIQIIILIVASGLILFWTYQPIEKKKVEIDYYAYQQEWGKVISMSEKLEAYDRMINFQFNRALTNTGQLLEKLFDYDQILGSQGLFLDKPFTAEIVLPSSDLYFDLGNIDESQRLAFESQTLMANSPRVLKRLILNSIIMGKYAPANTFINVLESNPMERDWVEKYRGYINNSSLADADPQITEKRMYMSKTGLLRSTPRDKLISQLEKNPLNKAAFENLIAFDLMLHDLTSFIEDMKFIYPLNYKKLPVILEEAVVLYRSLRPNIEFLNKIRISATTMERFNQFAMLNNANKGDKRKAKQATLSYKNTYWYYVLFLSPVVTNVKIVAVPADASH